MTPDDLLDGLAVAEEQVASLDEDVARLARVAVKGLRRMYLPHTHEFVQTLRGIATPTGPRLAPEGTNLRYAAMVALGLDLTPQDTQKDVLAGDSAQSLTGYLVEQAITHPDPGAVALTAWAAAEVAGRFEPALFDRLRAWLADPAPLPTVDVSWMLTAAIEARALGDTAEVVDARSATPARRTGPAGDLPAHAPAAPARAGSAPMSAASPTRCTRSRRLARYAAATGDGSRAARRPTAAPRRSASSRVRRASGGGTTTPGTARSSKASRSTACTSTRWPR